MAVDPNLILVNAIARAEGRIARIVNKFLGRSKQPTINQRNRELQTVKQIIAELDALVPDAAYTLVRHEFDNANAGLPYIGRVNNLPIVNDMSKFNKDAVSLLADNLTHRLGDASQTLGRRVDDVFRRQGLHMAAQAAVLTGRAPEGLQAINLQKRLEAEGLTAFEDRRGRRWQLSTYAEMVIRTTTSEARQRGVITTMASRNLDLVRVDKHVHDSDTCSRYDGKIFSLSGRSKDYPMLDKIPPFHPNCKHYLMPAQEAFAERDTWEAIHGSPELVAA